MFALVPRSNLFDSIWHDLMSTPTQSNLEFCPKLDIANKDSEIEVVVELPGVPKERVDVSLENGMLTIRGTKENIVSKEDYRECSYGQFERTVKMPRGIDTEKAKAEFKDGLLKISIPKAAEATKRTLQIT